MGIPALRRRCGYAECHWLYDTTKQPMKLSQCNSYHVGDQAISRAAGLVRFSCAPVQGTFEASQSRYHVSGAAIDSEG